MSNDATATIVGTLTRDFELRFTAAGKAVGGNAIAVNERRFDKQADKWVDGDTSFFDITVWDQMAEQVAESLGKGDRVLVVGRLRQENWETDNGEKRSKIAMTVDEIGPSLRWATCKVDKVGRSDGSSSATRTQRSAPAAVADPFDDPF